MMKFPCEETKKGSGYVGPLLGTRSAVLRVSSALRDADHLPCYRWLQWEPPKCNCTLIGRAVFLRPQI